MYKLFVYGQLMRGGRLNSTMLSATYLGEYILKEHKVIEYTIDARFLESSSGEEAKGELYLISEELKLELDVLENYYTLRKVTEDIYAYMV